MAKAKEIDQTDRKLINARFIDLYYILVSKRVVRTRKEFCDSVGLNPTSFSRIENGEINCTLRILCNTMKVYGVHPLWLLMADGEPFDK